MLTLFIAVGFVALVGFFLMNVYNRLVALRERVGNAFAQIDVQLEHRHDLMPNSWKRSGYMRHEQATLAAVVEARAAATPASTFPEARCLTRPRPGRARRWSCFGAAPDVPSGHVETRSGGCVDQSAGSHIPGDGNTRVGPVDAVGAGLHRLFEVCSERRMVLGDAVEGVAQGAGDTGARPFGR